MAKQRYSMRDGPLAQLFKATDAAGQPAEEQPDEPPPAPKRRQAAARPKLVDIPEATPYADPRYPAPDVSPYLAVIRVVGVGGGGCNAIDRMVQAEVGGVEFIAVNTDLQQLGSSLAGTKIHIGREKTQGLGSGADPEVGRAAAESSYDDLRTALRGSDMVFITAGEGGGTGTGAAPVIARVARECGALTVGIVTAPFAFEGSRRRLQADEGTRALRDAADTVIVIPNDRLLEVLERRATLVEAFRVADDVLRQGVQGICDLITSPGLINLDFADVRTIMSGAGTAMMGIGMATGGERAQEAAERAVGSPLMEQEVRDARGILLAVAGGSDLGLHEVNDAAEIVRAAASEDANIIFGATVDERLAGQLWVTVIATGFTQPRRRPGGRPAGVAPRPAEERPAPAGDDLPEPPPFLRSS